MGLSNTLKSLRIRNSSTLEKVAGAVGITSAHLSAIETGKIANPGYQVVANLAKFYGLSTSELLGETNGELPLNLTRMLRSLRDDMTKDDQELVLEIVQSIVRRRAITPANQTNR